LQGWTGAVGCFLLSAKASPPDAAQWLTLGAAALEGVKVSEDKVPPMDLVLRASVSWLALLSRDALLSACLSATMAEASACSKTSAVITWYKRSLTHA